MAISPINITRVSQNLRADSLLLAARQRQLELLLEQTHISTGLAFVSPSENPAGAVQALKLHDSLDRQDQVVANIQHASGLLDASDAALTDVSSVLTEARTLASQTVGSLTSDAEREATAELIASIIGELINVGNRQVGRTFIFAGRDSTEAPFESAAGGVVYRGDTGDVLARVSLLGEEPVNLPGNLLFGALSGEVVSNVDLSPALSAETRLEDVTTEDGRMMQPGLESIPTSGDGAFSVDLTSADTIGNVVDTINAAAQTAGVNITATLGPAAIELAGADLPDPSPAGAGPLSGLPTFVGVTLRRRVAQTTAIGDLAGGAGVDLSGGLVITNGGLSATIDLSEAETVQDVLNAINHAGLNVRAVINSAGDGISIINEVSGTTLTIGEAGGSTAAELGIRTLNEDTPLADLNFGRGVITNVDGPELQITATDGSIVEVDLDGALTVADVIAAINDAAADAGVAVEAGLDPSGTVLQIEDTSGGMGTLSVASLNSSYAAEDLGLAKSTTGTETTLVGENIAAVRAEGALTALVDLERSLRANDTRAITDAGERIERSVEDLNRVHGVVGARAHAMAERLEQQQDAVVSTRVLLSNVEDADFTETVTKFQQAQTALQAILATGSRLLNLSLLDFLG